MFVSVISVSGFVKISVRVDVSVVVSWRVVGNDVSPGVTEQPTVVRIIADARMDRSIFFAIKISCLLCE
jgi:hypothetical protein